MCRIQPILPILFASLLLAVGTASAEPVMTVDKTRQKQDAGFRQSSSDSEKNVAQTQIEQAADHFDAFALQMPKVINAKLDAFMKHGFRAILMDDAETKPSRGKNDWLAGERVASDGRFVIRRLVAAKREIARRTPC